MKKLTAIILCLMMTMSVFGVVAHADMPTIVMAYPTWTGRPAGEDRIQARLSAITEEKLGVKLEMEILDYGSWNQSMTLMLASGEQVDIFNTLGLGYSNCVTKGYALELDELLNEYGQGILETINPDYIEACRIDGQVFGVPQQRDIAQGKGAYVIVTKYLDEIGYDWQSKLDADGESIYCDLDEIKDIFARLHEAEPDKFVLCPNKGTQLNNTVFFDDTIAILQVLQHAGVKVGIVSTKYRYRIVDSFKANTSSMPVDEIIGGAEVKNAKPDPEGLELMVQKLGVEKADVLYVGDSHIDAQTAQNAGVDFAGVTTGTAAKADFEKYPHVFIANSLTELFTSL